MRLSIPPSLGKLLDWLETMRMQNGYWGPVVHYWQECLQFLGPSPDWKYEGLIDGFLRLYEKTGQDIYLQKAITCGDDVLRFQGKNGCFFNSHFENNPSLYDGSTPHESAVCIGLLTLAKFLREKKMQWRPYFAAAQKNIELYHFGVLYDKQKKIFLQYRHDKKHYHVPNKIATIVEMLYLYYDFTKDKRLLTIIEHNIHYILSLQDHHQFYGGIYQTEAKKHIITFYVARCIPALVLHYQKTNYKPALKAALAAKKFILSQRLPSGGYCFGYLFMNSAWRHYTYPVFVAGGADILRALYLLKPHASFSHHDIQWLLHQQLPSGAFPTSIGMHKKNTPSFAIDGRSWQDILPAVGWNDKVLRLLTLLLPKKSSFKKNSFHQTTISCVNGHYSEDSRSLVISGKESYTFIKGRQFRSALLQRSFILSLAKLLSVQQRFIQRFFRFLLR